MLKRLAKAISDSGAASRREAERMIEHGRVTVNDEKITTPVFFVDESHSICVDGQHLNRGQPEIKIWSLYKPIGYITTRKDPQGRKTVFDLLKHIDERLLYVGRLDINSEGLLLFTNNGNVSRYFELPKNKIKRTYKVRIYGDISDKKLSIIKKGCSVDGINYGPMNINVLRTEGKNKWLEVSLNEGKNREIRKVFSAFGMQVNRLIRIAYGPFWLGNLKPGELRLESFSFDSLY